MKSVTQGDPECLRTKSPAAFELVSPELGRQTLPRLGCLPQEPSCSSNFGESDGAHHPWLSDAHSPQGTEPGQALSEVLGCHRSPSARGVCARVPLEMRGQIHPTPLLSLLAFGPSRPALPARWDALGGGGVGPAPSADPVAERCPEHPTSRAGRLGRVGCPAALKGLLLLQDLEKESDTPLQQVSIEEILEEQRVEQQAKQESEKLKVQALKERGLSVPRADTLDEY